MYIVFLCIALGSFLVSGNALAIVSRHFISMFLSKSNYNQILWYKQSRDEKLQFLGYMYITSTYPEAGLDVKMDGSAEKDQTCTLTVEGLSLKSSAVYFCAASLHSASLHCSSVQKPPHHTFWYLCIKAHGPVHLCSFLS
uniref:Ig-like domain-containing protein n=1 Tax=Cyclopterus lumpus TaxID=8103 RepID=A0A8C3A6Y6_CYCLU